VSGLLLGLALLAVLVFGLIGGLSYRGFLFIGSRRRLDSLLQELAALSRIDEATRTASFEMRQIVLDELRSRRS